MYGRKKEGTLSVKASRLRASGTHTHTHTQSVCKWLLCVCNYSVCCMNSVWMMPHCPACSTVSRCFSLPNFFYVMLSLSLFEHRLKGSATHTHLRYPPGAAQIVVTGSLPVRIHKPVSHSMCSSNRAHLLGRISISKVDIEADLSLCLCMFVHARVCLSVFSSRQ